MNLPGGGGGGGGGGWAGLGGLFPLLEEDPPILNLIPIFHISFM